MKIILTIIALSGFSSASVTPTVYSGGGDDGTKESGIAALAAAEDLISAMGRLRPSWVVDSFGPEGSWQNAALPILSTIGEEVFTLQQVVDGVVGAPFDWSTVTDIPGITFNEIAQTGPGSFAASITASDVNKVTVEVVFPGAGMKAWGVVAGPTQLADGTLFEIECTCSDGSTRVYFPENFGFWGIIYPEGEALKKLTIRSRDLTDGGSTGDPVSLLLMRTSFGYSLPPPPGGGGADGDPHFLTWGHEWYDFMGQCDLMLVKALSFANGLGLVAEVRTKARLYYSFVESAAIQIGNEDIFEVGSFGQYAVNGISNVEMPATIAGFTITHEHKSEHFHVFTVDLGDHGSVILKAYKDLVGIKFMGVSKEDFGDSVGLMGSYDNGTHFARDGKIIIEDANQFGQEWQVQKDEAQIFMTGAPEGNCILPTPHSDTSRRLGETISAEAAEFACAKVKEAFEQCVYDVIATGDLLVAQAGAF